MRIPRLMLFVFLLFPVYLLCAWDVDLSLAVPGGIVSVTAVDGSELAGGVELWYQGRAVSSAEAMHAAPGYIALLPLPCDLSAAAVELRVKNAAHSVSFLELTIEGRDFIYEEIPLDTDMSELRQSDDPRKIEESRRMWELLCSFDPAAPLAEEVLILPVGEARQSSSYGDRRLFLYRDGGKSRSLHYGIDYAVPVGTPVAAAARGKVVLAADRMLTGLSLVLEHGPGIFSMYYHLDSLLVEAGDLVEQGETLGTSGITGLATGAHLHWELRINRVPVDPLLFLRRPFVLPELIPAVTTDSRQ